MDLDQEISVKRDKYLGINLRHIGVGIRSLRKINDLTLEALSIDTGIDVGYLSRLENGKCKPRIDTVSNILIVFDLTLKEFYDSLDSLIC